jgi:hypothetical protein
MAGSLGSDVGAQTEMAGMLRALPHQIRAGIYDVIAQTAGGMNMGGSAAGFGANLPVGLPVAVAAVIASLTEGVRKEAITAKYKLLAGGQRQAYEQFQQVGGMETPFLTAGYLAPGGMGPGGHAGMLAGQARAQATGLSQAEYMQGMGGFTQGYAMSIGGRAPYGAVGDARYNAIGLGGGVPRDAMQSFQDQQRMSQAGMLRERDRLKPEYMGLFGLDPGLAGSLMGGFGAGMGMSPNTFVSGGAGPGVTGGATDWAGGRAAMLPGQAGRFTSRILNYAQERGFRGSRANEWMARAQAGFTQLGEQGLGANPDAMMGTINALGQIGQTGGVAETNLPFGGMNAIRGAFKLRQGGIQAAQGFAGQMGTSAWADMAIQAWAFSRTSDPLKAMELMENLSGAQYANVVRGQLGGQAGGMALYGKGFTARQARGLSRGRLKPFLGAMPDGGELGLGAMGMTGDELQGARPITSATSQVELGKLEFAARKENVTKLNAMNVEMGKVAEKMMALGIASLNTEGPLATFGLILKSINDLLEGKVDLRGVGQILTDLKESTKNGDE